MGYTFHITRAADWFDSDFSDRAEEIANRLAGFLGARVQGDDED